MTRSAVVSSTSSLRCSSPQRRHRSNHGCSTGSLRRYLDDWTELTVSNVTKTCEMLETALSSRLAFQPIPGQTGASMHELTVPLPPNTPSLTRVCNLLLTSQDGDRISRHNCPCIKSRNSFAAGADSCLRKGVVEHCRTVRRYVAFGDRSGRCGAGDTLARARRSRWLRPCHGVDAHASAA